MATGIFLSDKTYQSLSPAHKAIIDKALVATDKATAEFWIKKQSVSKQEAIDHGAQIYVLPQSERDRFEAAVKPVYEKFAPEFGGMEMIEEIKAVK